MTSAKTGLVLAHDLESLVYQPVPLVEDFLYQHTVTMWASDPGTGKSVLATQLAISLSSGTPVFGVLEVPKPVPVYYLQLEGHYAEFIQRMRYMRQVVPITPDHLCWDSTAHLNVLRDDHVNSLIKRIEEWWQVPALIVIDPIYMAVSGGLSKDEPSSAFVRFSSILRETFGAAILLIHHTHKPIYQNGKMVEEDDPSYGSQWLKAHVDVNYILKKSGAEHEGVTFYNKKARGANVYKCLALTYHPETYTCSVDLKAKEGKALIRVLAFLDECRKQNRTTNFSEIASTVGVSHAHLRRLQGDSALTDHVEFITTNGHKTLWKPVSP